MDTELYENDEDGEDEPFFLKDVPNNNTSNAFFSSRSISDSSPFLVDVLVLLIDLHTSLFSLGVVSLCYVCRRDNWYEKN